MDKTEMIMRAEIKIAIIGLGYVGLPLATEFAKKRKVVAFDVNENRILELQDAFDKSGELTNKALLKNDNLVFTKNSQDLDGCKVFIITVPTPIDEYKKPDLSSIESATKTVSKLIRPGSVVIYESTVYPGLTEDYCVPLLEKLSGLTYNKDFFVGYSPERINPGDKTKKLTDIVKVTSGSTTETAHFVDNLYKEIISAGTFLAKSIKVAEAAKVIENTQRDLNIALMNELAMLFCEMGMNTHDILEAAGTKWNFLPFTPGLVGGHCIGVDPYYLTHEAKRIGFDPKIILAGRGVNDEMPNYVANRIIKLLSQKDIKLQDAKVTILGVTFKENCSDIRNSKVFDMATQLTKAGVLVSICDPLADKDDVLSEYGISLLNENDVNAQDAIILAVPHKQYSFDVVKNLMIRNNRINCFFFDLKSTFRHEQLVDFGFHVFNL